MSNPIKFFDSSNRSVTAGSSSRSEASADYRREKKLRTILEKSANRLTLAQTRSATLAEASFSSKLATSASFLPTFFVWAECAFEPVATLSPSVAGAVSAAVAPRGAALDARRAVRTRLRCRVAGIAFGIWFKTKKYNANSQIWLHN